MTGSNGYSGNNGSPAISTLKESGGFVVAEMVADATWIGTALIIDHIPKSIMKYATSALGKCLEPVLEPIEKGLGTLCKLEECKPDLTKSREERAQQLAKTLLVYVPGIYLSWQMKFLARRKANELFKVPHDHSIAPPAGSSFWGKALHYGLLRNLTPEEKMIFVADEGLHVGSIYALNRPLAVQTDNMIRHTTTLFQKIFGMSEEKAHERATAAWVWAVPNAIGALGGMLAIAGKHFGGWPSGTIGRWLGRGSDGHNGHAP